jgi:hypothetical protein
MKRFFTLTCFVLLMFGIPMLVTQAELVGHWTFEPGSELVDLSGNFEDVILNGATIDGGQLDLGVGEWAYVGGYSGPEIAEKTLVSWASLDDLTVRAGSIITLDRLSADQFDGIIYAERQERRWMNGSSNFSRTEDADPGFEETETGQMAKVAITYEDEGGNAHMRLYHNGEFIGEYTKGPLATWEAGDAEVFFGKRHGNKDTGGPGDLDAHVEEARVYNEVLSQDEIQALTLGSPTSVTSLDKLSTLWGYIKSE